MDKNKGDLCAPLGDPLTPGQHNQATSLGEGELGKVSGGQQQMPPMPPISPLTHSLCPVCRTNVGNPGFVPCAQCQKLINWDGGPSYETGGVFHPGSS